MKCWHGLESILTPFDKSAVSIGQFDGVHVGHQALMAKAVENANRTGGRSVAFTFDRHPFELIAPEKAPGNLTTLKQRIKLIEACGIDDLVIARFDDRFRSLSPEAFIHFVLIGVLGAQSVSVGHDFRFGCNQEGDVEYLKASSNRFDLQTCVIDSIMVHGEKASSTRMRHLIREGDVKEAAAVLGRRFSLAGTVVHGQKLGRTLGFPTANLGTEPHQVLPKDGVYSVFVKIDGHLFPGACSIGKRPTVNGTERTVETFLIDFERDLYDQQIEFVFVDRIRDEEKFDGLETLISAMNRDVEIARLTLRDA